MKKKLIIAGSITFSLLLVSTIAYFFVENVRQYGGVRQVKIVDTLLQGRMLVIGYDWLYSESMGYSIRAMDANEMVWYSESYVEDEGLLGKYRYEIKIFNVRLSSSLEKRYPNTETHVLKDVPKDLKSKVKIRLAYCMDDSTEVFYLGSDEPLYIEERGVDVSFPSTKLKVMMKP